MIRTLAFVVALAAAFSAHSQENGRNLASGCAICHGTQGNALPGAPVIPLAGLPREHIATQMRAFRDGSAPGHGDAPDRQGIQRRADRRHGGLVFRPEELGGQMKRRDFLKLAGAVSVAGCATATPSKARVVVVGGGFGGATAAKYIRLWDPSIDVVLVERDASFVSCPISNLVLAGYSSMQEITRGYDGLRRYGVQVVRDEATAIDPSKKVVRLARGGDIAYERLIVSPGIDFTFGDVAGYEAAMQEGTRASRLESRAADRGAAPPARRDARRRRLHPLGAARALPLPARAVRAREHGGGLLQAGEAALEGAGARCQSRRHLQGRPVQARLERSLPGDPRVPRQLARGRRSTASRAP